MEVMEILLEIDGQESLARMRGPEFRAL